MYCSNCGNKIGKDEKYCGKCGTKSNQTINNKRVLKIKFSHFMIIVGIIFVILIAFIFYTSKRNISNDLISNAKNNSKIYVNETNSSTNSKENTTTQSKNIKVEKNWYYDNQNNITDGEVILHIGDYINYDEQSNATKIQYISTTANNGYANQTFKLSDYKYGWRVLGIDNGQIIITSEDIIGASIGYTKEGDDDERIYYIINSSMGYKNAIQELNNICALYGQGKGASKSRSITVEDVNKITGFKPKSSTGGYEYWPPTLNSTFDGDEIGIKTDSVEFDLLFRNPKTNSAVADKYKGKTSGCKYWLASTFSVEYFGGNAAEYGLRCIDTGYVGVVTLYGNSTHSNGSLVGKTNACVRPVVYLDNTVKLVKSSESSNIYNIEI